VPSFRTGTVTAILSERPGLQRVEVDRRPAYVLTQLVGTVAAGDRVVVNTTAVELGLGTGGWDVVHWNLEREAWSAAGPGHVMKLRYTSLQVDAGSAEEHALYREPPGLDRAPVVVCGLHSQLGCVAVAFKELRPDRRLVYVMTDGAALPLAISDLVADLQRTGLVDSTVTAGHAFGGDEEAVNLPSALRVAKAAGADVIVVAPGPGGVGTGTQLGFSAMEVGAAIDAVRRDDGVVFVPVRWSDVDPRERHRGLSHHTRTVLEWVEAGAIVPVPKGEPFPRVGEHQVVAVTVPDIGKLLESRGVSVETMGRGPEQDRRFFAYAGAAGVAAARMR
jgi:hypothetical protein